MNSASEFDPAKETFENLEAFADRISEVLKCPITIEDANHRLIAYSTHDDRTDPARIATIIGRRVPDRVINSLWKHGVIPALLKSEEPIRVKQIEEIGLGNRVAISIHDDHQEVIGYIWALEIEQILKDDALHFLKTASKAAKKHLLQFQTRKNKKEEGMQEIFWQLLTGHLKNEEEIRKKLEWLQLDNPVRTTVIIFRFPQTINVQIQDQINYLVKYSPSVPILLQTIDFKDCILLAAPNSSSSYQQVEAFMEKFLIHMREKNQLEVQGSFGNLYNSMQLIKKSYKEALTVLEIKKKFKEETKSIYGYHDLGIYQFLHVLADKRKEDGYENLHLKRLKEYDNLHGSQLIETLEVFLDKDNHIHEAAKALHVHVNTLNYRLKRISEIAEINLKDPNQKITIYLDMKMQKWEKGLL